MVQDNGSIMMITVRKLQRNRISIKWIKIRKTSKTGEINRIMVEEEVNRNKKLFLKMDKLISTNLIHQFVCSKSILRRLKRIRECTPQMTPWRNTEKNSMRKCPRTQRTEGKIRSWHLHLKIRVVIPNRSILSLIIKMVKMYLKKVNRRSSRLLRESSLKSIFHMESPQKSIWRVTRS